ncbi:MAG: lysophospholipid acyltransferase family protein [Pseudomonadota bacterium]
MSESYFLAKDRWTTRAGEWCLYAIAWSLRWLTWPLPTRWLTAIAGPGGGWLMMMVPSVRRRALENLALVWPERPMSERLTIAKKAAQQFCRLSAEYARLDKVIREVPVDVQGLDVLHAAQRAGKGAVLVTAHFGNWEAARLAAKQAGFETGIIYRAFNNRYLDRFTMNLIPCVGTPVLQKGQRGMRRLVTHVARGGFVMILVDQRNSGAPFLNFLGHPAETVTAAADLAHRTGAALIPTRAVRNVEAGRFDVTFEPTIDGDDPLQMMQAVNDRISDWIREFPDQWFWFHRRWRSTIRSRPRPDEDPGQETIIGESS